jgi:hypothetical protein
MTEVYQLPDDHEALAGSITFVRPGFEQAGDYQEKTLLASVENEGLNESVRNMRIARMMSRLAVPHIVAVALTSKKTGRIYATAEDLLSSGEKAVHDLLLLFGAWICLNQSPAKKETVSGNSETPSEDK